MNQHLPPATSDAWCRFIQSFTLSTQHTAAVSIGLDKLVNHSLYL